MKSSWPKKASLPTKIVEVMEFQFSYFKSWKMMLWKFCTQYVKIWKIQQWPQDWKRSVFVPIPKKGNAKECSNYCTIALISHASKLMLKILQARLLQYVNRELPDVQACFRNGRGTRDQIANICWIMEKAREFQKNIYFCFIDWCFWTVVFEKTLESPLECKEIQPIHSEGDQPWDFFGRNDAKGETPVLWPPHANSWLIGKESDAGRDWGQEKGTTEDEMAGWHHWFDGHESEWTPGVDDG